MKYFIAGALIIGLSAVIGLALFFTRVDKKCSYLPGRETPTNHVECTMQCREAGEHHPDKCDCSTLCSCHR
ncbi:MAG TPA: hypothetical protein VI643_00830 [Planctomycetota bacterium]|nr:hypothetical protein [Planctomycetota bacterium]